MKLSICMMVKDEEKNLKRCLDNLKPLLEAGVAELIIVDTGSEDDTEIIARKYTDKVYFRKWNKNFSEMRNISISYAKGDWIFIIDADERLDDFEKLIMLMMSTEINKFNTLILQVKNLYDEKDENRYNLIASPRIFRNNGKFKYKGAVHNQPIFEGPNLSVDINITHFGYIITDKELMEKKYKRTTELLKLELKKDPKNLYYIYQLGVSYDMHNEHKTSLAEFRKAYNILRTKKIEEKKVYNYIYASYARIAYSNGEYKESVKIAKEGLDLRKDYVDLYYYIGLSEKALNNKKSSCEYFKKYLELAEKYKELNISKDLSIIMYNIDENSKSNAYYENSKYYLENKKYEEAYKIYNKVTNVNQKIYLSINILVELMNYSELREEYNNLKTQKEKDNFLCTLEEKINKLKEKNKIELYKEFSLNEDNYGTLNRIRLKNNAEDKFNLAKTLIDELNFNEVPVFYSELFTYIKEDIKLIIEVFKKIETLNLRNISRQLIDKNSFTELFENYVLQSDIGTMDVEELKVFICIATRLMPIYIKDNNEVNERYSNIFKLYIKAGINFVSQLYQINNAKIIYKNVNNSEDRFFMVMYIINRCIELNDKKSAVKYMMEAVNLNKAFSKYIDVYKDDLFNLKQKSVVKKEQETFESYKLKVKENISNLVNNGNIEESKKLISEYEQIVKKDIDVYSIKAVILIMENQLDNAEKVLKEGLSLDEYNFDLNYNMAYVSEINKKYRKSCNYYNIAIQNCTDEKQIQQIMNKINTIKKGHPNCNYKWIKIVFFVKQGMDSFLEDIINGLSDNYLTKKIIVTNYSEIDDGMQWADICWFEWCDELVIYGSKLPIAKEKKIVCRLHSYEAFTDYPSKVNWNDVDKLIFVSEYIKKFVIDKFKIEDKKVVVIPNGLDISKWTFSEKTLGFNIAYVGYINYKKGPMLLLHTFKAIYDKDNRYKLYIAGQFQDDRDALYFKQMTKEFGIEDNVIYEGWQNDLDKWLEDKNYILCTSILESQNMSVMQAMSKGIKPIIHNFVGAKSIYPKRYVWNTIGEAVEMIYKNNYNSKEYRMFIENDYLLKKQVKKIKSILNILDR